MNIGVIGLGRMGNAIAYRLVKAGFKVYGFDVDQNMCNQAQAVGVEIINSVQQMPAHVELLWLMVPAGNLVDQTIEQLEPHCTSNHTIVDGGNSHFLDSVRRAEKLAQKDIAYLDVGTSGGLLGREKGFSLMIGGPKDSYEKHKAVFAALAWPDGYEYLGPSGAGHYVKMVHNGIEYALLQAYAEGFDLLKHGKYDLDLAKVSSLWMNGSVIRSWIVDLAHNVFMKDQNFDHISGKIGGGQTGQWTLAEAHEQKIPVPLIEESLRIREQSQKTGGDYATKLVALLRNQFGGHPFEVI